MSERDPVVLLADMLAAAERCYAKLMDKSVEDLVNDEDLGLIVTRLLEIIGEAANRVPKPERANHPTLAWDNRSECETL